MSHQKGSKKPPTLQIERWVFVFASIAALLSILIGAFAAHGLKATLSPQALNLVETGARYQMYHALGLFVVGLSGLIPQGNHRWLKLAAFTMAIGVVLFSGSLYFIAISQIKWVGMITPLGGTLMVISWAFLAVFYVRLESLK